MFEDDMASLVVDLEQLCALPEVEIWRRGCRSHDSFYPAIYGGGAIFSTFYLHASRDWFV